jgi:hypothetical protein
VAAGIAYSHYTDSPRTERSGIQTPLELNFPDLSSSALGPNQPPVNGCSVPFQGIDRPELGLNYPPLFKVEVKERVELYLYLPSVAAGNVKGEHCPFVQDCARSKRKSFVDEKVEGRYLPWPIIRIFLCHISGGKRELVKLIAGVVNVTHATVWNTCTHF